nr:immunoglobulin heavy chain junction region [Mus musculus]
CTPTGYDFDYW